MGLGLPMSVSRMKVLQVFVAFCLAFLSIPLVAHAETAEIPFPDAADISKGTLIKGGAPVANGDVVNFDDQLLTRYDFALDDSKIQTIKAQIIADPSTAYTVPLPRGLVWKGSASIPLNVTIDDDGVKTPYKFGDLVTDETLNSAYVRFSGTFWEEDFDELTNAYIEIACALDAGAIGADPSATIAMPYGANITVKVGDNQAVEHALEKPDAIYENNRFNWKVTFTPGSDASDQPFEFVDTFASAEQVYVADSFTVNETQAAPTSVTSNFDGTTTLRYSIPEELIGTGAIVVAYQTALSDDALTKTASGQPSAVHNAVQIENASGSIVVGPKQASGTASANAKKWLTKNGVQSPTDTHEIDWTVDINTNDRRLIDLIMCDKLPKGLALKTGSVAVNGVTASSSDISVGSPSTDPEDEGSTTFRVTIPTLPPSGGYGQTYRVTYTTTADAGYFDECQDEISFDNAAWLEFDWMKYNGTGLYEEGYESPKISTKVDVDTDLVKKAGTYNRSNHTITWTVTVNPHKVDVKSGILTDDLAALGVTYVPGSFDPGLSTVISLDPLSTDKDLKFTVGALGEATETFSFDTTVDDPADYAANTPNGKSYINMINFTKVYVGASASSVSDSATGEVSVASQVVSKAGAYDPSTNDITWAVVVNQNNMPMDDAVLADTMPQFQEYVAGSAMIDGSAAPVGSVDYQNGELTLSLGTIPAQTTVSFKTHVDVDAYDFGTSEPSFKNSTQFTIGNEITLSHDGYDPVTTAGSAAVQNKALSKTGAYNGTDNCISYAVTVNPNGLTLDGVAIADTLPDGLALDAESIALYDATINANGTFAKGTPVTSMVLAVDFENNSFSLTLPDGPNRYILEYDCYVADASRGPFENKIAFDGDRFADDAASSSDSVGGGGGGGGATGSSSKKARIKLTDEDATRPGLPIEGCQYALYTEIGGVKTKVGEACVDTDGYLEFYPLTIGKEYTLEQTQPVEGYGSPVATFVSSSQTESLGSLTFVPAIKSTVGTEEIRIRQTPISPDVVFSKVNDQGLPLDGAVFEISETAPTTTVQKQAISGSDGIPGQVKFGAVPFGEYDLKELSTAPLHILDTKTYKLTVATDGAYEIVDDTGQLVADNAIVNETEKGSLTVVRFDEETGEPLSGIAYALTREDGIVLATGITDADGKIVFDGVPLGIRYVLSESPQGGYAATPDKVVALGETDPATGLPIVSLEVAWPKAIAPPDPVVPNDPANPGDPNGTPNDPNKAVDLPIGQAGAAPLAHTADGSPASAVALLVFGALALLVVAKRRLRAV